MQSQTLTETLIGEQPPLGNGPQTAPRRQSVERGQPLTLDRVRSIRLTLARSLHFFSIASSSYLHTFATVA